MHKGFLKKISMKESKDLCQYAQTEDNGSMSEQNSTSLLALRSNVQPCTCMPATDNVILFFFHCHKKDDARTDFIYIKFVTYREVFSTHRCVPS